MKKTFTVAFEYNDSCGKWKVMVSNAADSTEAVRGFNAVLLTMDDATVGMHNKAELRLDGRYEIVVGVHECAFPQ